MSLPEQNIRVVPEWVDEELTRLTRAVRNDTLETAAKVAALYGAPAEAIERILMLRAGALT